MAAAASQARKIQIAGSSTTVASAWTVSAGSALVCHVSAVGGAETNHAASGGTNGAYTRVGQAAAGNARASVLYKVNAAAGLESLTVNGGASCTIITGIFHEATGVAAAAFTTGEAAVAAYASTTNPQSGSVTNAVANSIFFAGVVDDGGANPSITAINATGSAPASGWATLDATNSQENNGSAWEPVNVVYRVVSSSAATKHGWTTEAAVGITGIIAFGASAAAPARVPPRRPHHKLVALLRR